MTAAEMLADARTIYRLAAEADVDARTVIAALKGRQGKGAAYRRVREVIAAWPPKPNPCPACAAKDGELAGLRARIAELEAERQASDAALCVTLAPVPTVPPEPEPLVAPITGLAHSRLGPPLLEPPAPAPPPDPTTAALVRAVAPRKCKVTVLMPGEELAG